MISPKRIQRKRQRGWRMPANTIYVGRPTPYGNPWRAKYEPVNGWVCLDPEWLPNPQRLYCADREEAHDLAAMAFRRWVNSGFCRIDFHALKDKNLACWCPEAMPCHADTLLYFANN